MSFKFHVEPPAGIFTGPQLVYMEQLRSHLLFLVKHLNLLVEEGAIEVGCGLQNIDGVYSVRVDGTTIICTASGLEAVTVPGITDHGALTGLADDDHPQYQQRGEYAQVMMAVGT